MKKMFRFLLLTPIFLLPGCAPLDWIKEKLGGSSSSETITITETDAPGLRGDVLVTLHGKPIITLESFEAEFNQLMEENPQVKAMASLMPDIKENFLKGLVNQEIVNEWARENKVDQTEVYRNELKRMEQQVIRMLNTKHFSVAHPVDVAEAELKNFYEKNKDMIPDLLISRGGVETVGISFDSEKAARAFYDKVKDKPKEFNTVAEADALKGSMKEFKLINAQSIGVPQQIRDKVVGLKKFPIVELIKVDDKSFWVVDALKKEETKYRSFEEVKASLEPYVAKEKRMEIFDKEIEKLKSKYNVVINDELIKAKKGRDAIKVDRETVEVEPVKEEAASESLPEAKVA